MKRFQIIVEGDADKKFFEDYYHHIFGEKAPKGSITHPGKDGDTGGYQKLKSEDAIGLKGTLPLVGSPFPSMTGHSGLKHTEKYTRAVDKLKEDAINSLPALNL